MFQYISRYFDSVHPVKAGFCLLIAVSAAFTLINYPGAAYSYLLFTLAFNALLISGFREKRIFFDTFIGIFLWLGFWFKLSFTLVFLDAGFGEPVGDFIFAGHAFDRALNVSSCGALALLLAGLVRAKLFSYPVAGSPAPPAPLEVLYSRFRTPIWIVYALIVVLVAGGNVYFGLYQRGLPPRTVLPFGLSGVYTLAILFGLASVSAVLLNCELRMKRSHYLPAILSLLECFASNVSMLSRGMFLNASALLLGIHGAVRSRAANLSTRFKVIVISVFLGLSAASLLAVNHLRVAAFHSPVADSGGVSGAAGATRLVSFVNRWVGIEGVMSVTAYEGLGWGLWREAWSEKFSDVGTSLYDRVIVARDSSYLGDNMRDKHFITLPGLVAFFYYPGSFLFLFFCLFLAGLFAAGVEAAVYRFSGANLVLCALLGQVVAFRYVHFGYAPGRSYLLFGGILIVALSVFVVEKFAASYLHGRTEK